MNSVKDKWNRLKKKLNKYNDITDVKFNKDRRIMVIL